MHRDKTVARILLIISVVHVAAAAPATVRHRPLDVDEDVRAASEKRGYSGNTPQDSHPVPQMDDDPFPASVTALLDDDPQPASGASHLHNNPPLVLGTPQLHGDLPTASETSSAHDNPPFDPQWSNDEYRFNDVHYATLSHESETPPGDNHLISYSPSSHESEMLHGQLISDKLNRIAAYTFIAVSLSALTYGLYHHFKHTGRDLTSSDVVGRGVSTHPRHPRKLVSRALANLRNEDLRLLSVLTRKALERLD